MTTEKASKMAHLSEAACLLKAGALYTRRVLLEPAEGEPIFAGFKRGAFSVYFGDAPIFHFDLEGRWQRVFIKGTHYLKSLDTTVQAIEREREGENLILKRRTLARDEVRDLDARIREAAIDLSTAIESRSLQRIEPAEAITPASTDDLVAMLGRITRWDESAWASQRESYQAIYGPIAFLPPEALGGVILQGTIGSRDGRAFGGAPAGALVVRDLDAFASHAQAASHLLGRRTEQFKHLFLGGSDLVLEASHHLSGYLRVASETFAIGRQAETRPEPTQSTLRGIQCFLDRFDEEIPTLSQWVEWRSLGLSGVTLGIESGDPEIRARFGKRHGNAKLKALVQTLGEAGLKVGVVILLGAGGEAGRESHLAETVSLVSSLSMRPGEIVSMVEYRSRPEGDSAEREEMLAECQSIKTGLKDWKTARGTKVVFHNLEKQEAIW